MAVWNVPSTSVHVQCSYKLQFWTPHDKSIRTVPVSFLCRNEYTVHCESSGPPCDRRITSTDIPQSWSAASLTAPLPPPPPSPVTQPLQSGSCRRSTTIRFIFCTWPQSWLEVPLLSWYIATTKWWRIGVLPNPTPTLCCQWLMPFSVLFLAHNRWYRSSALLLCFPQR